MSPKSSALREYKLVIEMGVFKCNHPSHQILHSILYALVILGTLGDKVLDPIRPFPVCTIPTLTLQGYLPSRKLP